jgi:hypothetical protein
MQIVSCNRLTTDKNEMYKVRYSSFENISIGLMLITPAIVMDYIAITTMKYDFFIFTFLMTIFLGWFAFSWIKNGIRRRIVVQFDNFGVTSFDPKFQIAWTYIYGYKFKEYSGKFKTLELILIFDYGKTSTIIDVSFCDKKIQHIREYLSGRLKEFNEKEYETTIQKNHSLTGSS